MAETDYVVTGMTIKHTSVIKLQDFYKVMKSWLVDNGYAVSEKDYSSSGKKSVEVKWECVKVVDEYTMFVIEIKFKAKDIESIEVNRKKLDKCSVELKFESYLKSDYEDFWEEKGTSKLIRAMYDKFALKGKMKNYGDELKQDTNDIFNEMKSYLKIHVLK